ncbi:L,D-transpeptidase [Aquabacterium sp.]|uniref:L,D-transpeptidase n=1 Tax=Aquabacterium sp. TaxID=1872578 RepID=UPI002C27D1EB|nr:L,D-transpeptidase [Aquabacterium sp.]HSW04444.1 L,D-transpeptidase [Aquabacterium sp.]
MSQRVRVAAFDAVGGPSKLAKADDGFYAGPTDAGTYRISHCGQHSSPSYPVWSKIRWGSAIKEEGGTILVMHGGKWQPLSTLSPTLTRADLVHRNTQLYGKAELPATWVFNDFGHITCYFYNDKNGNGRLDKDLGERIHTEYFHTTPNDEAADAAGKPVSLSPSHGCIHLKPKDIDELIAKGYFKAGNKVVVHRYSESVTAWELAAAAAVPFEVHFFPGAEQVIVTGRRPNGAGR